ncbi:hypothetical protein E308F_29820 [Moorella sp. E308F]|nr:hypothetical protein E308F_29820 [Moorella sp. E308F]
MSDATFDILYKIIVYPIAAYVGIRAFASLFYILYVLFIRGFDD